MKRSDPSVTPVGTACTRQSRAADRRREIVGKAHAERRRTLGYLRDLVEDSDLRQREIEDRLGLSRGYVSQVLNGYIDLKVRHLEGLLEALDVSPAQFFGRLFPRSRPRPARRRHQADLKVSRDVIEIYSYGIASVRELRQRLERCEKVITAVARSGAVEAALRSRRGE